MNTSSAQRIFDRRTKTRILTLRRHLKPSWSCSEDTFRQWQRRNAKQRKQFDRHTKPLQLLCDGGEIFLQMKATDSDEWTKRIVERKIIQNLEGLWRFPKKQDSNKEYKWKDFASEKYSKNPPRQPNPIDNTMSNTGTLETLYQSWQGNNNRGGFNPKQCVHKSWNNRTGCGGDWTNQPRRTWSDTNAITTGELNGDGSNPAKPKKLNQRIFTVYEQIRP